MNQSNWNPDYQSIHSLGQATWEVKHQKYALVGVKNQKLRMYVYVFVYIYHLYSVVKKY